MDDPVDIEPRLPNLASLSTGMWVLLMMGAGGGGSREGRIKLQDVRVSLDHTRISRAMIPANTPLLTLVMAQSTIKLISGYEMPLVGFGLWKVPATQAADTVYNVRIRTCSALVGRLDRKEADETLTSLLGHQDRLPAVRRSVRLPEREGGRRGHPACHPGRAGKARRNLHHDEALEQLPPSRTCPGHGQGPERGLGPRLY